MTLRICLLTLTLWIATATWAQSPPPEAAPSEWDDAEVFLVLDNALSEGQALEDVARRARALGWQVSRRPNGVMVFRPPQKWAGKAVLRDGVMKTHTPLIKWDPKTSPVGFFFSNPRKAEARNHELLEALRPELDRLHEATAQRALVDTLHQLPGRLDALWTSGEPLSGDTPLPTAQSRRQAMLNYWSSRLPSPEGVRVLVVIEDWLLRVVQTSDQPVTEAEADAAQARRPDGRRLPL